MEASEAKLLASLNAQARALHKLEPVPDDPTIEPETVEKDDAKNITSHSSISSAVTASNIFRHPDTHPVVLDLLFLRKYGADWMLWDSSTLFFKVEEDFKAQLSDLNISKLMALKTLHMVDSYWQRWEVFNWCTASFNSLFPDFEIMQVPTVAQCMVSVDIANRIRDDMEWSSEIKEFIKAVFSHDQIAISLPPLEFVETSAKEFDIDVKSILERWSSVKKSGKPPSGTSLEDLQIDRMLTVQSFLDLSRARLRIQLHLVPHV